MEIERGKIATVCKGIQESTCLIGIRRPTKERVAAIHEDSLAFRESIRGRKWTRLREPKAIGNSGT